MKDTGVEIDIKEEIRKQVVLLDDIELSTSKLIKNYIGTIKEQLRIHEDTLTLYLKSGDIFKSPLIPKEYTSTVEEMEKFAKFLKGNLTLGPKKTWELKAGLWKDLGAKVKSRLNASKNFIEDFQRKIEHLTEAVPNASVWGGHGKKIIRGETRTEDWHIKPDKVDALVLEAQQDVSLMGFGVFYCKEQISAKFKIFEGDKLTDSPVYEEEIKAKEITADLKSRGEWNYPEQLRESFSMVKGKKYTLALVWTGSGTSCCKLKEGKPNLEGILKVSDATGYNGLTDNGTDKDIGLFPFLTVLA